MNSDENRAAELVPYLSMDTYVAQRMMREYREAIRFDDKNYRRSIENRRFFWAVDNEKGMGAIPEEVVQSLLSQRRQVSSFNIGGPLVEHLCGALVKNPFSVDYAPIGSGVTSLTETIKNLWFIDRDLMNIPEHYFDMLLNGCIYRADAEIFVSKKYNRQHGNIGIRVRLPGAVTYDPYWRTRPSRDCKKCWVDSWMTPKEIVDTWDCAGETVERWIFMKKHGGDMKEAVKAYAQLQAIRGDEYGENKGVYPYSHYEDEWGGQQKVVTQYEMVPEETLCEYVVVANGPVKIPPELTDAAQKLHWLNTTYPNEWQPEGVYEETETEMVQRATVMCPNISQTMILGRGKTEVQVGRLQFIPWAVNRLNGEWKGLVDDIKDACQQVNYLMSMQMYKINIEGTGGSQFVDPDGFDSDEDMQDYIQNRNDPSRAFRLKTGYLRQQANGPATPTLKSAFSTEVTNYLGQIIDVMLPRISRITPASLGKSETSGESGYLYRLKKIQSDIQQYTIFHSLRLWWQEFAEAYYEQAIVTYGNRVERDFYDAKTKSVMRINEHKIDDEGYEVIENDLSQLKNQRHKVHISEGEDSPTRKVETMMVANDALRNMPESKPLAQMQLGQMILESMDQFEGDKLEELKKIGQMELKHAVLTMQNNILEQELLHQQLLEKANTMRGGQTQPPQDSPAAGAQFPTTPNPPRPPAGPLSQDRQSMNRQMGDASRAESVEPQMAPGAGVPGATPPETRGVA